MRRTSLTFGRGSSQSYSYDGADRLTSLAHTFPNGAGSNVTFGYGYDAAGRTIFNPAFVNNPASSNINYDT